MNLKNSSLVLFRPGGYLKGLSGNIARREELATQNRCEFQKFLMDKFTKNGSVTKEDLNSFYKTSFPDINISVKSTNDSPSLRYLKNKSDFSIKGFNINIFFQKKPQSINIWGKKINIPFFKEMEIKQDNFKQIETLLHEHEHLLTALFMPKHVFSNHGNMRDNLINNLLNSHFYKKNLYCKEYFAFNSLNTNKNRQYLLKKYIKNQINSFFSENKFNSTGKVKTLTLWLRKLENEQKAYRYEKFSNLFKKNKSIAESTEDIIFIPAKIELLKEMIYKEITNVRVNHKNGIFDKKICKNKLNVDANF